MIYKINALFVSYDVYFLFQRIDRVMQDSMWEKEQSRHSYNQALTLFNAKSHVFNAQSVLRLGSDIKWIVIIDYDSHV